MRKASDAVAGAPQRNTALGVGEQLLRDARTRLIAASAVVLVHSAYPPGHPALAPLSADAYRAQSLAFSLLVAFPVNTFVMLSFLNLAPRVEAGVPGRTLLRTAAHRLVRAHVFWVCVYLSVKALAFHRWPSWRDVVEGVVLGTAAAHLYFTPLLLALTATAPLLFRLARTPRTAIPVAGAVGLCALGLELTLSRPSAWSHAFIGFVGYLPIAVAGLALGRWWRGVAPAPDRTRTVVRVAVPLVLLSAAGLVHRSFFGYTEPASRFAAWLAANGYALGVPMLLLARRAGGTWVVRLAPLTLGVYFVHPIFIQGLRVLEARFPALHGSEAALSLPNAALAIPLSFGAVALIARSPLRRCVL
jgi:surface polysaccharide O-acyltransferase-like enzyme